MDSEILPVGLWGCTDGATSFCKIVARSFLHNEAGKICFSIWRPGIARKKKSPVASNTRNCCWFTVVSLELGKKVSLVNV